VLTYHKKLIEFESGSWKFFDFEYLNDSDPIQDWYDEDLSEEAQDLFDDLLKDNQKTANHLDWIGWKRYLKGVAKEERIWELQFVADKRQYRILGKFGFVRKQAILLCGCYHKQGNYTPTGAIETACGRSKALTKGEGKLRERPVKQDI
jgi:hypothetical protein